MTAAGARRAAPVDLDDRFKHVDMVFRRVFGAA
jgi:hypothetical protein